MDSSVKESLKKFAKIGIASKGVVYLLVGGLTCAAALGLGGQSSSGKKESLSFVYSQPFGKVLLFIIGIGLLGYTFYRIMVAIKYDKSNKEWYFVWGKKIAYAGSGLIYAAVAYSAIKMAVNSSSGGSGGDSKQSIIQELLGSTAGQVVLFVFACIIIGRALFQFYMAWTGKFSKRIEESRLDKKSQKTMEYTGVFGYSSRGIVICIIAYMFIKAVLQNDPSNAEGTSKSFELIQSNFGPLVLAIISLGLFAYGVFMLIKAYYCYVPEVE